eukprot:TRINITY_DN6595_c0_g1_i2.p1 TRINITY_DN6595_c0_g1~~TRINITY_DN6595_c0_g1_i2.p1  ORF type:complete len:181 (+),score=32.78 TRINITY_DN6595_c0_g1_i2:41-583(+)
MDNSVYGPIAKRFLTACRKGRLYEVEELLTSYDDAVHARLLRQKDMDGYTGLHKAAYNGHAFVVEFLLEKGCDVNVGTKDNWRPLHCTARWNKVEAAKILLARGADINLVTNAGMTPLHIAASYGDTIDMLQLLLQNGAGFDHALKDAQGNSVIDLVKRGPYSALLKEPFPAWNTINNPS